MATRLPLTKADVYALLPPCSDDDEYEKLRKQSIWCHEQSLIYQYQYGPMEMAAQAAFLDTRDQLTEQLDSLDLAADEIEEETAGVTSEGASTTPTTVDNNLEPGARASSQPGPQDDDEPVPVTELPATLQNFKFNRKTWDAIQAWKNMPSGQSAEDNGSWDMSISENGNGSVPFNQAPHDNDPPENTEPAHPAGSESVQSSSQPPAKGMSFAQVAADGLFTTAQPFEKADKWFARKNPHTNNDFFPPVKEASLNGLNAFAIDETLKWPTYRRRDQKTNSPIFHEKELQRFILYDDKNHAFLDIWHLFITFDPRLLKDPAQYKQYMEDHGIYMICDFCREHKKRCSHGLPCNHCATAKRNCQYVWAATAYNGTHPCTIGWSKCYNLHSHAIRFFEFASAMFGLFEDIAPSKLCEKNCSMKSGKAKTGAVVRGQPSRNAIAAPNTVDTGLPTMPKVAQRLPFDD